MGFQLGGFLAGVSDAAVDRMQRVEDERIRIAREERSIGTQMRMARESERRKKQAILDESAGMLAMLGYDKDTINGILAKGTQASAFAITAGQTAMSKGIDPNTIWNFSTDETGQTNQDKVNETIEIAEPTKIGDITATSEAPQLPTGDTDSIINLDVYQNLFAEPDKVESSFSARLSVISQKLARNPNRKDANALKAEQEKLLEDLRTMKEAERDDKGTNSESLTSKAVNDLAKQYRNEELITKGFKLGVNDAIENMEDGSVHLAHIANINVARRLHQANIGVNDSRLQAGADQVYKSARANLQQYAYDLMYNESNKFIVETDQTTFNQKYDQYQYKVGDVISFNESLYVYTNALDHTTGMRMLRFDMSQ